MNPRLISWFTLLAIVWTGIVTFLYHFPVWFVPIFGVLFVGLIVFVADLKEKEFFSLSLYLFGIKDFIHGVLVGTVIVTVVSFLCFLIMLSLPVVKDSWAVYGQEVFYGDIAPVIQWLIPYCYLPSMIVPFLCANSIVKELEKQ